MSGTLNRSHAHRNIIMMHVFAAATNASSGVITPRCPWASGGAEKSISAPFPQTRCPQCSPFQATLV